MRLRIGRARTPAHAALLAAAGVDEDVDITRCTVAQALTAGRVGALAPDVAEDLAARRPAPVPALTTPGGLGPRAEAAGLAALLKAVDAAAGSVTPGSPAASALAALRAGAVGAAVAGTPRRAVGGGGSRGGGTEAAAALMAWAATHGVEASAITPALFQAGGEGAPLLRGVAAARPIRPGDAILTVPAAVLITPAAAAATELGSALAALPGVGPDDALLAWTLVDSADAQSPRAPVWAALRAAPVVTGLSVSEAAAAVLDGTPAGGRLQAARAHVRAAFDASRPLFSALSKFVDGGAGATFGWGAYAWAASVWYAFAVEVQDEREGGGREGGGSTTPALVPVAFLLNHEAAHATAVRYGLVEKETGAMRVIACAPASPGDEVTLSYGAGKSNADLLVFYGFAVERNPDDSLELEVGGKAVPIPARDFLGARPLGPGPGLVAAAADVVAAAERAAAAFDAAAERARTANVDGEDDEGWVAACRVYAEGGADLARAVAARLRDVQ